MQPPGSKLAKHSQLLALTTVSPLPVTTTLQCDYPFSIVSEDLEAHHHEVLHHVYAEILTLTC